MRKNYLNLFYLIILFFILFNSCSKQSDNLNAIPKDAILVASFDVKSLVKKSKLDDFKEMNFYKLFNDEFKNENPAIAEKINEILENPLSTGVDFLHNSYLFITAVNPKESYIGFTIGLRNSSKFEEFLKDFSTEANFPLNIEDVTDFKVIRSKGNNDVVIGWDDEKLLILSNLEKSYGAPDAEKKLKDYYRQLITQEKSNSILENSSFADFNKDTKDISAWISFAFVNKIANNGDLQQYSKMIDPKIFEDSYMTGHLEFKDGEISLTYKGEFDDKIFEQFANDNIVNDDFDTKILDYVPAKQYVAVSLGIFLDKYYENITKLPQFAMFTVGFEQEFEKNTGAKLSDVLAAFDGDFLLTLSDIQNQTTEKKVQEDVWIPGFYDNRNKWHPGKYEYRDTTIIEEQVIPIMSLCATFNKEEIFTKIINLIPPTILTSNSDFYEINIEGIKIYALYKDGVLMFSNGLDIIGKAKNGGYGSEGLSSADYADKFKNCYSFAFLNLDYESYPLAIKSKVEEGLQGKTALFNSIVSIYDNIQIQAKDIKNVDVTIKLKTDDENSLYTIINSFDENLNELIQL